MSSDRLSKLARQVVNELDMGFPFTPEPRDARTIYLRNNENPFGGAFRTYPEEPCDEPGLAQCWLDLIAGLEHRHDPRLDYRLTAANILLTHGAAAALEQIFKAYFEPGLDRIIVTPPLFGVFTRLARIYDIDACPITLQGDGFDRLDLETISASNAKGILLCDPNNPVGSRLHPDDIAQVLEQFPGVVVIDEAYVEYSRRPSNLRHLETCSRLLILRTMSKALGMAGLRIGAAIGAAEMIEPLRRVQLPFAVSSIAATWCRSAMTDHSAICDGIQRFRAERDRVADALRLLPYVTGLWGEDGGFLTIRTSRAHEVGRALHAARIQPTFNPQGLQGFIRLSIGMPHENDCLLRMLHALV